MSSLHVFSAACMLSRLSTHAVASLLLTLPLSLVKKQYVKALQALKQLEDKQQALIENSNAVLCSPSLGTAGGSSSMRPPLETRHHPNQQLPAQQALEHQQAPPKQPSQV